MQHTIFSTLVLMLLLLTQANMAQGQTVGSELPGSADEDVLIINQDKSNHYSRIRFQTQFEGWNLRNTGLNFQLLRNFGTNHSGTGLRMLNLAPHGGVELNPDSEGGGNSCRICCKR